MNDDDVWAIDDEHGTALIMGLRESQVWDLAFALATGRGAPVYVYCMGEGEDDTRALAVYPSHE